MIQLYGLMDNEKVFYIGQSVNPKSRLSKHIYEASFREGRKDLYIREMLARGVRPTMAILGSADTRGDADGMESQLVHEYPDVLNTHFNPMAEKKSTKTHKCPRDVCGYEWTPRVDNPVQCPLCKQYLESKWNKSEHLVDVRVDEGNDEK